MTSADMSEFLRVTRDDHVAVLTIDRPEKRNAMTAGMWTALPGVLAPLADDAGVRTLIVTGAGASFCAGDSVSAGPAYNKANGRRFDPCRAHIRRRPAYRLETETCGCLESVPVIAQQSSYRSAS